MADILTSKIQVPSLPDDTLILKDAEARNDLSTSLTTATGNPLNFSTRSAQKANKTVISLAPIQDLHGYDHPWPAGGGKNKLPFTVAGIKAANTSGTWTDNAYTINDVTLTILTDDDGNATGLRINGQCSQSFTFHILSQSNAIIPSGCKFNLNASKNNSNYDCILMNSGANIGYINGSSAASATANLSDTTITSAFLYFNSNYNDDLYIYPIVRESNESAAFAPYSNYCPIDGRTETSLVGCGKNEFGGEVLANRLVDVANATKDTINKTVTYSAQNVNNKVIYDNFKPNARYTFFFAMGNSAFINMQLNYTDGTHSGLGTDIVDGILRAVPAEGKYVESLVGYWSSGNTTLEYEKCGIFEGVVERDDFIPYTPSNDLTIQFGEKVYGAKVELEKGTVTVEWGYIAEYNGETLPGEWISDRDVYAPNTSPSTGAEVAYELATPHIIHLTPQQVSLLQGVNNISTDGDSITLTYRDGKVATLADLTDTANNLQEQIDQNETIEDETTQLLYKLGVNNGLLFIEEV